MKNEWEGVGAIITVIIISAASTFLYVLVIKALLKYLAP